MIQLLMCLRFYATNSFLITLGDYSGIHMSTASRVIVKVSRAIAALSPHFIKMPATENERRLSQTKFYEIASFPRVIGAIDCTHVRIQSPGKFQYCTLMCIHTVM